MNKKMWVCLIVILSIIFMFVPSASVNAGSLSIVIDGKFAYTDTPPVMEKGRVLVPLRAIFDALDGTLNWDAQTSRVTGFKGARSVDLYIGNPIAVITGSEIVILDVPAKIINGRTFVPLRFIAEALGAQVEWDGVKQLVNIISNKTSVTKEIADIITPAVVSIETDRGLGTGFFWNKGLEIITNAHVIHDAQYIVITTYSREKYNARVLVEDSELDLAKLEIVYPDRNFPYIQWSGFMNDVSVGDPVIAIGHPLGLNNTVSEGLVSAKRMMDGITQFQISAPISPGNSGGPLLDYNGRVIGINASGITNGQNLNFAIPFDWYYAIQHRPNLKYQKQYNNYIEDTNPWFEKHNNTIIGWFNNELTTLVSSGNFAAAAKLINDYIILGLEDLYLDVASYQAENDDLENLRQIYEEAIYNWIFSFRYLKENYQTGNQQAFLDYQKHNNKGNELNNLYNEEKKKLADKLWSTK